MKKVPTARFGPILTELVEERVIRGEDLGTIAKKADCHEDGVRQIMRQRNKGCDFDLADRLLCALGRPDIWTGALRDIYLQIDLSEPVVTSERRSFACGHPETDENSVKSKIQNGVLYYRCRTCAKENRRTWRAKQKVAA